MRKRPLCTKAQQLESVWRAPDVYNSVGRMPAVGPSQPSTKQCKHQGGSAMPAEGCCICASCSSSGQVFRKPCLIYHLCLWMWECRCQTQDPSHSLEHLPRSCYVPAQQLLAVCLTPPRAAAKNLLSLALDTVPVCQSVCRAATLLRSHQRAKIFCIKGAVLELT